jgi:hypothetical protein
MNHILKKGIPLSFIFVLVFSALPLVAGEDIVGIQAVINTLDLKKNVMIANERLFELNTKTTIHNNRGAAITIDQLKPKTWVYVEGLRDKKKRGIVAQKIYVIPKYIEDKDKRLYPFIK